MSLVTEDGPGVDHARLRADRRLRVLEEMERRGVDALLLAREGNAKYVSGARRLWRSVVTVSMPTCVLVRATGQVHLTSTWDDGIPAEIPVEHLWGLTWDPDNIVAAFRGIEGLATARTIGVDGMSPFFARMLPTVAPGAEVVDGEALLRDVRSTKLPAEVALLRTATAIAEGAMAATLDDIEPGVGERQLLGRFEERMTGFGTTLPALEGSFCATPREGDRATPPLRQATTDRALRAGDLVACSSGVLHAGYEGGVGRTWPCLGPSGSPTDAQRTLHARWWAVREALLAACRPGRTTLDLRAAAQATGEPLPPMAVAHGVGLGVEHPLVPGAGATVVPEVPLVPGMVLAIQGYAWEPGVGGCFGKEVVVVTDDGTQLLTRLPPGPLDP